MPISQCIVRLKVCLGIYRYAMPLSQCIVRLKVCLGIYRYAMPLSQCIVRLKGMPWDIYVFHAYIVMYSLFKGHALGHTGMTCIYRNASRFELFLNTEFQFLD